MIAVGVIILIVAMVVTVLLLSQKAKGTTVTVPASFPWRGRYDALIFAEATAAGIEPALLKAIVSKESGFDSTAINPEKTFTLAGRTYAPGDALGRAALREAILQGFDPLSIGVNPSIGLAQVRVTTARDVLPGVSAQRLFEPQTNLRASALYIAWLFRQGFAVEQIDAYNVGPGALRAGTRNPSYRDRVLSLRATYLDDFPQET